MIGVFGGSGFIGRNLVDRLNKTHRSFQVFSRRNVAGLHADIKIIDFERPESYREYLKRLETVVLLVSASVPSTFANDIASEVEKNVLPYSRFLRVARSTGIRHFIYVSSGGAVYGQPIASIITEEHPTNPISPYGCAKLMIEEMIRTMSAEGEWTYTILRASNPIGPYQSPEKGQGLVARALDAAISNTVLDIWGDGTSLRDYIDVRDLCDVIERCVSAEIAQNEIYNVGAGRVNSVNEIVEICAAVSGIEIKKSYIESKSFLVKDVRLSIDKMVRDLGWRPKFDVQSSIKAQFAHTFAVTSG
ncbi:NAD-dependent epimerase/dehydratase family protein [Mesorhizobium sp.]|uniref:NAD-dependent epimerase/dehydratase family protein n=1 Tax=Mesorhizobium sp. TaxID=1871066 RepID=UPI000FE483BC|nr:NAD-dependent epimerase/dehydratase family protein [Mesorhizobium sp.]RWE34815.1 MAG: NAD-dependent epimerase/dehydratase family protein [Mesorhizobium sp.]